MGIPAEGTSGLGTEATSAENWLREAHRGRWQVGIVGGRESQLTRWRVAAPTPPGVP